MRGRRLASAAAEGSVLRFGRDPSAPRCPLNRGWRRRRRAPLGRLPGSGRLLGAAAPAGDGSRPGLGAAPGGARAPGPLRVPAAPRGDGSHGGERLCCGSGCRRARIHPYRAGRPPGAWREGAGSAHSPGRWLPGVSRPSPEHLLCARRALREAGLLPLPSLVGQCPRRSGSRTPVPDPGQVRKMPRVWLWEEGEACEAPPFGSCSRIIMATK